MIDRDSIEKKIEMSLDTMRSYLQTDGGDIEIVEITKDMNVKLRFKGNCLDCVQVKMTSASIEEAIKNYIPEINKVEYID